MPLPPPDNYFWVDFMPGPADAANGISALNLFCLLFIPPGSEKSCLFKAGKTLLIAKGKIVMHLNRVTASP
jgi:hypothetical protein